MVFFFFLVCGMLFEYKISNSKSQIRINRSVKELKMPISARHRPIAHRQVNHLVKEILRRDKNTLYEVGEISVEALSKYGIDLVPFDFETLENEEVNLSLNPPVLFHPLPLSILQEHPINPEELGGATTQAQQMTFREYDPPHSFERKDTAPWDFFSRFILSRPLKEFSNWASPLFQFLVIYWRAES